MDHRGDKSALFVDAVYRSGGGSGDCKAVGSFFEHCGDVVLHACGVGDGSGIEHHLLKADLMACLSPFGGAVLSYGNIEAAFAVKLKSAGGNVEAAVHSGLYAERGDISVRHNASVAFNAPVKRKVFESTEEAEVLYSDPAFLDVVSGKSEGLYCLLELVKACVRTAVGINKTVNAEVAVVGTVAKVAAVGVVRIGVYIVAYGYRVIEEFPYTAAEEGVAGVYKIPVLLPIAWLYSQRKKGFV